MNVNEGITLLPLLKVNQRASGVKMLRSLLRIAGYTVYNVTDTFFDAKLYSAVLAFQEAEKLSMDGVVGTGTWMRLRTRAAGAMIGK
jgi:peptidoglycan hydrolase-like protein with peptidoglycan-binding domain